MPSRLQESLKEKVKVRLRSSDYLTTRDVQLHMSEMLNEETMKNDKVLKIEVQMPEMSEKDKTKKASDFAQNMMHIRLCDITSVKVKNFVEKLINVYVVSVTCEDVQYFLEFETQEKRDDWGNGLRSLHHSHQWANKRTEAKTDARKLHLIKAINLKLPAPGCIISMEIETAGGRKADLDIPDAKERFNSSACKELTHDFVLQNYIVPAEGASLYRFIRSVLSRLLMERETNVILGELDSFRYNKVTEGCAHRPGGKDQTSNASEVRMLLHTAEERLRDLAGAVPERIGRHGPSSQLLVDILLRSIEKTKIYNKMAFAVNYGNSGEELEY